ncbi:MAG: branched-chain amino acid ABC transporter permease [Rhodobacteraceae bacterium]|nr:branched-chain amino acid ABC transporter permease [Paracoccaceae bacterium]
MELLNAAIVLANFIVVPALSYGSQLALGALGVTLIYSVFRFADFAHGDTMSIATMMAIFVTWWLQAQGVGIAPLPIGLLAIPVAAVGTGILLLVIDRLVYRHYRRARAPLITFVIVSVGVMLMLNGLTRFIIGPGEQRFADGARFIISASEFKQLTGLREGLAIKTTQVITFATAWAFMAFLFWFLKFTRTGTAIRAFSDNEELALLSGISPKRVVTICWLLVALSATIAGTLYGLDKVYKPFNYFQLLLPIFAAAVVGGMGSPTGAVLGGYLIAFSEIAITYAYKRVAGYLLPESWQPEGLLQLLFTDYKFAVSFGILVVVLIFRPTGLIRGHPG